MSVSDPNCWARVWRNLNRFTLTDRTWARSMTTSIFTIGDNKGKAAFKEMIKKDDTHPPVLSGINEQSISTPLNRGTKEFHEEQHEQHHQQLQQQHQEQQLHLQQEQQGQRQAGEADLPIAHASGAAFLLESLPSRPSLPSHQPAATPQLQHKLQQLTAIPRPATPPKRLASSFMLPDMPAVTVSSLARSSPTSPLGPPRPPPTTPVSSCLPSSALSTSPSRGHIRGRSISVDGGESDSRDALSDTTSESAQSDVASVCSTSDLANIDLTSLVKEELKQAIKSKRKVRGLPDVEVDFKPKPLDQLTPEEEERRRVQKERNREAAAKCRIKKRDAVGRLMDEVQILESANEHLRREMTSLEAERDKLQILLDMHPPGCIPEVSTSAPASLAHSKASIANATGSSPDATLVKRSRPSSFEGSVVNRPGDIQVATGGRTPEMTLPTTALQMTLPTAAQSDSSSYVPLAPSTTSRQRSVGPATPTLLSHTSVVHAPPSFPVSPHTTSNSDLSDFIMSPLNPPTSGLARQPQSSDMQPSSQLASSCLASPDTQFVVEDVLGDASDTLPVSFLKEYLGDDYALGNVDIPPLPATPTPTTTAYNYQESSHEDFMSILNSTSSDNTQPQMTTDIAQFGGKSSHAGATLCQHQAPFDAIVGTPLDHHYTPSQAALPQHCQNAQGCTNVNADQRLHTKSSSFYTAPTSSHTSSASSIPPPSSSFARERLTLPLQPQVNQKIHSIAESPLAASFSALGFTFSGEDDIAAAYPDQII